MRGATGRGPSHDLPHRRPADPVNANVVNESVSLATFQVFWTGPVGVEREKLVWNERSFICLKSPLAVFENEAPREQREWTLKRAVRKSFTAVSGDVNDRLCRSPRHFRSHLFPLNSAYFRL